MREIVLDTETTGLDPINDRVVEIGCVELINHMPTGQTFHAYCNPDCEMPADAFAIHGISDEFLAGQPSFAEEADALLAFLGDAPIVAHNGQFDLAFLNAELERVGRPAIKSDRLTDTLMLARRKHPGAASLDALCDRYRIDKTERSKHGALVDAELLAKVYLELIVDQQGSFDLTMAATTVAGRCTRRIPLAPRLTADDIAAHRAFIATAITDAIWNTYWPQPERNAA